jgi:hypothetical protein
MVVTCGHPIPNTRDVPLREIRQPTKNDHVLPRNAREPFLQCKKIRLGLGPRTWDRPLGWRNAEPTAVEPKIRDERDEMRAEERRMKTERKQRRAASGMKDQDH